MTKSHRHDDHQRAAQPEVAPESPATRQTTREADYPRYGVEPGRRIDLGTIDPDDTGGYTHKDEAESAMTALHQRIEALQARLYAENKQSLFMVLQALDAGARTGRFATSFTGSIRRAAGYGPSSNRVVRIWLTTSCGDTIARRRRAA